VYYKRPDQELAGIAKLPIRKSNMPRPKNVLGTELQDCSTAPLTGFFRDGCCNTGPEDVGLHTLCAEMSDEFLAFSKSRGNDLSTPNPMFHFPGLVAGDRWCLCVLRWKEAFEAGMAPRVNLQATHMSVLEFVDLEHLQEYAVHDA
jgi:uncharacterized protein (DUF2237 family)